jgi:hypothetical protein
LMSLLWAAQKATHEGGLSGRMSSYRQYLEGKVADMQAFWRRHPDWRASCAPRLLRPSPRGRPIRRAILGAKQSSALCPPPTSIPTMSPVAHPVVFHGS